MTIELAMPTPVNFTDNAVSKVKELIAEEGTPDLKLRVFVSGGGCSGFQYEFSIDEERKDDDLAFDMHGVEVIIDEMSLELVDNAELDYVQDLMGSFFAVSNPNATASCGCGTSFSV